MNRSSGSSRSQLALNNFRIASDLSNCRTKLQTRGAKCTAPMNYLIAVLQVDMFGIVALQRMDAVHSHGRLGITNRLSHFQDRRHFILSHKTDLADRMPSSIDKLATLQRAQIAMNEILLSVIHADARCVLLATPCFGLAKTRMKTPGMMYIPGGRRRQPNREGRPGQRREFTL